MLKIHELTEPDGSLSAVYLRIGGKTSDALEVVDMSGALPVPPGALEKVLARYGAPFDDQARVTVVAELQLDGSRRLRHVRHLAGYDVVPRDYLVLEAASREATCAMAATVAGALLHLARAARAASSSA